MDIIIFFLDDYSVLKEKIEFQETKIYILLGEGQNADSLKNVIKEKIVVLLYLKDPDDKKEGIDKIKKQLLIEDKKIDTIYLTGKNHLSYMNEIKDSIREYKIQVVKNNLKKQIDKKKNQAQYETSKNNSITQNKSSQTMGSAIHKDNLSRKSYKNDSSKTEEEKKEEEDIHVINTEIKNKVKLAKQQMVNAITERIQFHLKVLTKSDFTKLEVLTLMQLMVKLTPKKQWKEKEGYPWSLKAERKKLLESWNATQGNKALNASLPTGEKKDKLNVITEENYNNLKAEMIYYYNLAIFLYNEDFWC